MADAKAAWTGNLIGHERILPMLLEGGPGPYLETLDRFQYTLDVKTIIPGHGPLGGAASFAHLKAYLWDLLQAVDRTRSANLSERAAVAALQLDPKYWLPFWYPMSGLNPLLETCAA